jgi:hypothetical protein
LFKHRIWGRSNFVGQPVTQSVPTGSTLAENLPLELRLTMGSRKLATGFGLVVAGTAAGWFLAHPLTPILVALRARLSPSTSWGGFLVPLALLLMLRLALAPTMLMHPRVDRQTFEIRHWHHTWTGVQYYFSTWADALDGWLSRSGIVAILVSPRVVRSWLLLCFMDAAFLTSYLRAETSTDAPWLPPGWRVTLGAVAIIGGEIVAGRLLVLLEDHFWFRKPYFQRALDAENIFVYLATFALVFQLPLVLAEVVLFGRQKSLVPAVAALAVGSLIALVVTHVVSLVLAWRDNRWMERLLPELSAGAEDPQVDRRRDSLRKLSLLPNAKDDERLAYVLRHALEDADLEARRYAERALDLSASARQFLTVFGLSKSSTLSELEAVLGPGKRTYFNDKNFFHYESLVFLDGRVDATVCGRAGPPRLNSLSVNARTSGGDQPAVFENEPTCSWLGKKRADVLSEFGSPVSWNASYDNLDYGVPDSSGAKAGSVMFFFKDERVSGFSLHFS